MTAQSLGEPHPKQPSPAVWLGRVFARIGALPIVLLAVIVVFAAASPVFLTAQNLSSLASQSVFLLLIATAQLIVLIAGGFDLSVGANVALTSVASATVTSAVYGGYPEFEGQAILWGAITALVVGAGVGLLNGFGVAVLKVNPFIVTLATSGIVAGVAIIVSRGQQITGLPPAYTHVVGSGSVIGIPWLLILSVPVVLVVHVLLSRTRFGRRIYALGGNPVAASVAGIGVKRNLVLTYVIAGIIVAMAGWLLTARVASGQPSLGTALTMQSLTAALIGGASLSGGRGNVGGMVLGVVFIMLLTNGMNLMRLDTNTQTIAIGIALVVAVVIDRLRDRTREWVRARRQ
jgi:ribose/xylose/arabinose/galactoside ABC-type transport system permease subunit